MIQVKTFFGSRPVAEPSSTGRIAPEPRGRPPRRGPTVVAALLGLSLLGGASAAAKKAARIEGRVVDIGGNVLEGAKVTLTSSEDPAYREEELTGEDGKFDFRVSSPVGSFRLRLEKEGYSPFETEVELAAGDRRSYDFRLISAAEERKNQAIAAYNAGVAAFERRELEAARRHFAEAVELDPELVEPHLGLADIAISQGRFDDAVPAIERYRAARPSEPQILELAYEAYAGSGDEERLAGLLAEVSGGELAPSFAARAYNAGVEAHQAGRTVEALRRFQTAAELDPELVPAHSALATLAYNMERYDEAMAAVGRLLERQPEHLQGRRIRFLIHDAREEGAAAAEALEAYFEVDPDGAAELLYQRGELDFRAGLTPQAKTALLKVVEILPEHPRAHYVLGQVYASEGQYERAKAHLRKFLELAPDDPETAMARRMLDGL